MAFQVPKAWCYTVLKPMAVGVSAATWTPQNAAMYDGIAGGQRPVATRIC